MGKSVIRHFFTAAATAGSQLRVELEHIYVKLHNNKKKQLLALPFPLNIQANNILIKYIPQNPLKSEGSTG